MFCGVSYRTVVTAHVTIVAVSRLRGFDSEIAPDWRLNDLAGATSDRAHVAQPSAN